MPMNSGYELSPRINLSHKWIILCNGNTSAKMKINNFESIIGLDWCSMNAYVRENIVRNHGIANNSGMKFMLFKWLAKTGS